MLMRLRLLGSSSNLPKIWQGMEFDPYKAFHLALSYYRPHPEKGFYFAHPKTERRVAMAPELGMPYGGVDPAIHIDDSVTFRRNRSGFDMPYITDQMTVTGRFRAPPCYLSRVGSAAFKKSILQPCLNESRAEEILQSYRERFPLQNLDYSKIERRALAHSLSDLPTESDTRVACKNTERTCVS